MTDLRTAAERSISALENLIQSVDAAGYTTQCQRSLGYAESVVKDLRAALAQPAGEPIDTSSAVGGLIYALNEWKRTSPQTAPPKWTALVEACRAMVEAARHDRAQDTAQPAGDPAIPPREPSKEGE